MILGSKMPIMLVLVTASAIAIPVPRDDFDMPDVYSSVFANHELKNFKFMSQYHKVTTATSTSNPITVLEIKSDISASSQVAKEMELNIMKALQDIETFSKMLDADAQYIENRKREDPSWPNTLISKVESKTASEHEVRVFNEDMERSISFIVLMKVMELRLSLINEYIQQTIADNPNVDMNMLLGKSEKLPIIQGLFEMKYFEGLLHSVNSMVEETLTEEAWNSVLPTQVITPGANVPPAELDTEFAFDFATLIVLLFTVMGFFFALFLFIYLVVKTVRNCLKKGSEYNKKSKYEQI